MCVAYTQRVAGLWECMLRPLGPRVQVLSESASALAAAVPEQGCLCTVYRPFQQSAHEVRLHCSPAALSCAGVVL